MYGIYGYLLYCEKYHLEFVQLIYYVANTIQTLKF